MVEYIEENEEQEEGGLFEHYRLTVDQGQKALRIDKYLSNRIENASRSRIQAAAEAGNILANEKPVKPNYKVKPNDEIVIVMDYPPPTVIFPVVTSSSILPSPAPRTALSLFDDLL